MSNSEFLVGKETGAKQGHTRRVLSQLMDTLDVLRPHFEDPLVSDIMINGPDDVFVDRRGMGVRVPVSLPASNIRAAISLIAGLVEKEVGIKNKQNVLSARLPGFRVEAILPPVAVNGPSMCIRRHSTRVFSLGEYVVAGVILPKYAELLTQAVLARENFLIVGGTGSGKTTLMNTALSIVPASQRLFVIETVHELQIVAPNKVLVECDDEQGMTPRKAVRTAMRYAPKRVIVGELRGPEAHDWMDAANTGHPGSAATIHANGAAQGLARLENLVLMADMGIPHEALKVSIADTVQWLFYIAREGDVRKVTEVCRVNGYDRDKNSYILQHF
ncbi:MAG: ATPase, T2SS/T4P/T4SS family [Rhodoferax sp.]|nr:ATPase, T2SS/T4P/T4SS family [Rhodoferax sp.]